MKAKKVNKAFVCAQCGKLREQVAAWEWWWKNCHIFGIASTGSAAVVYDKRSPMTRGHSSARFKGDTLTAAVVAAWKARDE